jgi:hypothetical protein
MRVLHPLLQDAESISQPRLALRETRAVRHLTSLPAVLQLDPSSQTLLLLLRLRG